MAGARYEPSDRLYLWLLTRPQQPVPIGELNLVRSNQGVSLRYGDSWLQRGFPLSEDLPLIDQEFLPRRKALRPARWTTLDRTGGVSE